MSDDYANIDDSQYSATSGDGPRLSIRFVKSYDIQTDVLPSRVDCLVGMGDSWPFDWMPWYRAVLPAIGWLWRNRVVPAWHVLTRPIERFQDWR